MICADPNETTPLYLKSSESAPEADRPTLLVKFMTDSEIRTVRRLMREAKAEADDDKAQPTIERALRVGIVGARNLKFRGKPLAFEDITSFSEFFSENELIELVWGQLRAVTMGEQQRFLSDSDANSALASIALSAPAGDAKANPPK
jgi:hypothetical protein